MLINLYAWWHPHTLRISVGRILGAGVFFDRYKFRMSPPVNNTDPRFVNGITREFFGPYAWRKTTTQAGLDTYNALDFAGFDTYYTDQSWFQNIKSRWGTNFYDLKKYVAKPMIRWVCACVLSSLHWIMYTSMQRRVSVGSCFN